MKLIVSDFDLTLFDNNYDENIKLVNELNKKDFMFVIATGRSIDLLKKDLKNINFKYLICSDGSVILDNKFNILNSITFDKEVINEIITLLKNDPNLSKIEIDENINGISGVYAVFNDLKYAEERLNYIIKNYDVSGYVSTNGINIINKNISKVEGIEYIKKITGINDIYTIGDNINDLEMISKYNGYMIGKEVKNFKEFIEKIVNI